MTVNENGMLHPFIESEPKVEFAPFVSISLLEYENLIRADEALKIVTELLQAEKDNYANVKNLKVILGISD